MKNNLLFFFSIIAFWATAQPSIQIENVTTEQLPNNVMRITYDLLYPTNDLAEVTFRATKKGGVIFDYATDNATGAVGTIGSGTGLQIEWDYSDYASDMNDFRLMLTANLDHQVDIQALVNQVDSARISGDLSFLEGIRHRTAGAAHLAEVQEFLRLQFMEYELDTEIQSFQNGNYTAQNIIGRLIGTETEGEVYILDGHYDSVDDSPGADDNASAVAGMLEAMRILAPYGFKKSIRFIGFDLEEAGLIGSTKYVQEGIHAGENIDGVLNFEMIGYYSSEPNSQSTPVGYSLLFPDAYAQLEANEFRGDFINLVSNSPAQPLVQAYETAATTYVPALNTLVTEAPSNWSSIAPDLGRSDHAPFWIAGTPAIMLTDGANFRNPYYHSPDDTSDKLNFTFMHNVVQATVATLAEVAGIQEADTWWGDTDFFTDVDEVATCTFGVSPNPAHEFVQVEWTDCQLGNFTIELIDITGRAVRHFDKTSDSINSHKMDVRDLERGVYFLKIKSQNGQWVEQVVVD